MAGATISRCGKGQGPVGLNAAPRPISIERAEAALSTLARVIVDHPQFEDELLLLFEKLEDEIVQLKSKSRKLDLVRQLATSATRDNQSRA